MCTFTKVSLPVVNGVFQCFIDHLVNFMVFSDTFTCAIPKFPFCLLQTINNLQLFKQSLSFVPLFFLLQLFYTVIYLLLISRKTQEQFLPSKSMSTVNTRQDDSYLEDFLYQDLFGKRTVFPVAIFSGIFTSLSMVPSEFVVIILCNTMMIFTKSP